MQPELCPGEGGDEVYIGVTGKHSHGEPYQQQDNCETYANPEPERRVAVAACRAAGCYKTGVIFTDMLKFASFAFLFVHN